MTETYYAYENEPWQPAKRRLWWRILKPMLILALPIGIIVLGAAPLAVS